MKKLKVLTTIIVFIFLLVLTNKAYNIYINYYEKNQNLEQQDINVDAEAVIDPVTVNNKIIQHLNLGEDKKKVYGIGFKFGTYGRTNSSDINIVVKDTASSEIIYKESVKTSELLNDEYKLFDFENPITTNSIDIELTSNAKNADDAVTLYISQNKYDKSNVLYNNENIVNGSLCSHIKYKGLPFDKTIFVLMWIAMSLLVSIMIYVLISIINSYISLMKNIRQYIANFNKYIPLLKQLVMKEIKLKYKRSALGFAWSILNPLLMMCVMTVVFSTLFKSSIKNFPVYLILGQIVFSFFSDATNGAMNAVVDGAGLITKVYIPKYIFPMAKVLSALVNLLFSLVAVVIVIAVTKVNITPVVLLFPVGLIYVTIFALGIGLILSAYSVFFRDIKHLYGILLLAWNYLTPIFYPIDIIPKDILFAVKANPMYCYIDYFRQLVLEGKAPSISLNLVCIGYALIVFIIGTIVFYKKQDDFILYL